MDKPSALLPKASVPCTMPSDTHGSTLNDRTAHRDARIQRRRRRRDADEFAEGRGSLKDKIDGIEKIESGKDFSGRAGDFTHAVIVTMRDKDVLAAYGPHPAHKEVQDLLHPVVKTLWVIDFEPV